MVETAMNPSFKTLAAPAQVEQIEKRSRFICRLFPVATEEAALERLLQIQKENAAAAHNVFAYRLQDGARERFSDDGEPQGTAGMPTLQALRRAGLTNCVAVTTRWFGGVLLGANGLTRAYAQTAAHAVEAAQLLTMTSFAVFRVSCAYSYYGKLAAVPLTLGGAVEQTDFVERVDMLVRVPAQKTEKFIAEATQVANGQVEIAYINEKYFPE
jgi:uncharacterized YigZ family protein